jgi:pimeloyl-ACP methyl ester carboxylesterase
LVGWATGGQWLGQYAATHPGRVSHLAFYNSLYGATAGHPTLGPGSDYEDPGRPGRFNAARFGAYRLVTAPSLLPAWDETIPVDDKAIWRDPVVVEAYTRAAVASDPTSRDRTPPSFRAPSGALADSYELATGRLPWHAGNITAATLIVRGEYDFWSRPGDIESLTRHLVRAVKVRAVELTGATHFAHLDRAEHGRGQLLDALTTFLDE